jgi:predicted metalloendopeptidase
MVAEGLWLQSKKIPADREVLGKWRKAVAQDFRREHSVSEIFEADKEVAEQWIQYWSQGMSQIELTNFDEETVAAACAELSSEVRKSLLANLHSDSPIRDKLIRNLVSDDPNTFRQLLKQESLADFSLSPLQRMPDEAWVRLAQVAVSEGVSEDKIAKASGLSSDTDFDTVEDRLRTEILAWNHIIEKQIGAISRIARRRRATRMKSLAEL